MRLHREYPQVCNIKWPICGCYSSKSEVTCIVEVGFNPNRLIAIPNPLWIIRATNLYSSINYFPRACPAKLSTNMPKVIMINVTVIVDDLLKFSVGWLAGLDLRDYN